jgi:transcription elongation GreA/GreB family factor
MDKAQILQLIVAQLTRDLAVQFKAAITAHEASTDSENIPDNKYETLALEASYVAQGQANRAQELKRALEAYKQLTLLSFEDDRPIRLTALVSLAGDDTVTRTVFIGPLEGGMKVTDGQSEVVVITPASPLGRSLIGKTAGDVVTTGADGKRSEIVAVC